MSEYNISVKHVDPETRFVTHRYEYLDVTPKALSIIEAVLSCDDPDALICAELVLTKPGCAEWMMGELGEPRPTTSAVVPLAFATTTPARDTESSTDVEKCETCGGTGDLAIHSEPCDEPPYAYKRLGDCPTCKGTGRV